MNYVAHCKEKTIVEAMCNSHAHLWPSCLCVIEGRFATFYKEGVAIHRTNVPYARDNFILTPGDE